MHVIVHVDIYFFLCSVSYNYITIILIITALYYFCSITQKDIYIAMHYYFKKNKTIIFIIKVRLDNLRKQYNVKLEFK